MWELLGQYQINLIIRMIVACACGIVIGIERKNRAKEAGIRTHCIVACASAMMMIISKYGFSDLIRLAAVLEEDVRLDPSRMAQGIVTGVGFLGAGIIYFQRGAIKGLTTAAGVWAVSGIGMAIGAGMYIIGISATLLILLAQIILHSKSSFMSKYKTKTMKIYGVDETDFQKKVMEQFQNMDIGVLDVSVAKNTDGTFDYAFCFEVPKSTCEEGLVKLFPYRCSIDFTN